MLHSQESIADLWRRDCLNLCDDAMWGINCLDSLEQHRHILPFTLARLKRLQSLLREAGMERVQLKLERITGYLSRLKEQECVLMLKPGQDMLTYLKRLQQYLKKASDEAVAQRLQRQVILIRSHQQTVGLLTSEIIQVQHQMEELRSFSSENEFIQWGDEQLPLFDLDQLLFAHIPDAIFVADSAVVLVVRVSDQLVAFKVAEVLGRAWLRPQQLCHQGPHLPYIEGAGILNSGQPAFLVSLRSLYQQRCI